MSEEARHSAVRLIFADAFHEVPAQTLDFPSRPQPARRWFAHPHWDCQGGIGPGGKLFDALNVNLVSSQYLIDVVSLLADVALVVVPVGLSLASAEKL
jgi:hypothetical protein